uniref:Uncharacterized protein n=1 Tax=Cacopsylla melanoneura TaxID=428564 RepID=A0A8D8TMC1_9HEMI
MKAHNTAKRKGHTCIYAKLELFLANKLKVDPVDRGYFLLNSEKSTSDFLEFGIIIWQKSEGTGPFRHRGQRTSIISVLRAQFLKTPSQLPVSNSHFCSFTLICHLFSQLIRLFCHLIRQVLVLFRHLFTLSGHSGHRSL